MAVEGGMKCVKYLIFLFNLLFWICGIALIGLGIYVQVYLNKSLAISASASGAPIVLIAVGVVIFFISFFGCCGAAKENYCMVTTFAVLLGLIFLVEIAAAIAGYVFRNKVQDVYKDSLKDSMAKYNNTLTAKDEVDEIQKAFKCCGANSSKDWQDYPPFSGTSNVPDSCCKVFAAGCGKNASNIYTVGCISGIDSWMKTNVGIIAGVALGIAFFEILGIVFACCLMKGIRSGYEVM
ncbi:CD63 antigen [Mantella aurantiaca]